MTSLTNNLTREEYNQFLYGRQKRPRKPTSDPSHPWFLDGPMKGKQSAAVPSQRAGETLECAAMNHTPWRDLDGSYPKLPAFTTYRYECLGHLNNGRPIYAYRGSRP